MYYIRYIFVALFLLVSLCDFCVFCHSINNTITTVRTRNGQFDYPRKFCGRQLADTLSLVCRGVYRKPSAEKKSVYMNDEDVSNEFDADYEEEAAPILPYPFRLRSEAEALLTRFKRHVKRGIANECCKKSCYYKELISYCGKK